MRQGESTSRCTDCATALYRDNGSGGSIYNVASRGEHAVERVARRYCSERGLGSPAIGNRYTPPLGSGFWGYDFSCGARGETSRDTPAAQEPAGSDPDKVSATCTSLGFRKGAPEHDHCIQRLTEMNSTQATEAARVSLQQQLRQQQREQAVRVLRQGLDGLSPPPPAQCEAPTTMTIKLPCGDIVSCTKKAGQVNCD
jgi:hypothetical protein